MTADGSVEEHAALPRTARARAAGAAGMRRVRWNMLFLRIQPGSGSGEATTNERVSLRPTAEPASGNCRRIVPAAAPS